MIEKIKEKNFFSDDENLSEENNLNFQNEKNLCLLHKVSLELICLQCEEKICYQCGLFGNHKNHKVEKEKDFIEKSNLIIEKIRELKKNLEIKLDYISNCYYDEKVKPRLYKKKLILENSIKKLFMEEKKRLEKEEKDLLKENEENFINFKKFYEEKITNSFDFLGELKDWKNQTDNFLYKKDSNFSKITNAFFILKKNKKEDLLDDGSDLLGRLTSLIYSYDKKIDNYINDLQIEKSEKNEKFLNLINPLIDMESLIINSDFGFKNDFQKKKSLLSDNKTYEFNKKKSLLPANKAFEFNKKKSFTNRKSFTKNISVNTKKFLKTENNNLYNYNEYSNNNDIKLNFFNNDNQNKNILKNSKSSRNLGLSNFRNNLLSHQNSSSRNLLVPKKSPIPLHRKKSESKNIIFSNKKSESKNLIFSNKKKKSNSKLLIKKKNKSISKLFINNKNTIEDLKQNNLTFLNLKNSEIKFSHLKSISSFLYKASNLKEIDLSKNKLNDDCVKILYKILSHSQIRKLNLSHNSIKDKGLKLIKQLCVGNKNIISVNVKHNLVSFGLKNSIKEDMRKLGIDFQT